MEEKLCSIEEFEKNKDAFEKEKPPFVCKYVYRIKVENIPRIGKSFVVQKAIRQKNPHNLEWKYEGTYKNVKDAQKQIDIMIEEQKIDNGYYIEAYINYPENQ